MNKNLFPVIIGTMSISQSSSSCSAALIFPANITRRFSSMTSATHAAVLDVCGLVDQGCPHNHSPILLMDLTCGLVCVCVLRTRRPPDDVSWPAWTCFWNVLAHSSTCSSPSLLRHHPPNRRTVQTELEEIPPPPSNAADDCCHNHFCCDRASAVMG